jgi:hypothetical protein
VTFGAFLAEASSELFALVPDVQLELPTFEAHQHSAKVLPGDLSPINDEDRHVAILGVVPLDPPPYDTIRDLQAKLTAREMFGG